MVTVTHRTNSGVQIAYTPYSPERLAQMLAYTEITADAVKLVASYDRVFTPRIPAMVDSFYAHLGTIPELRAVVERFSSIEQLKKTLREYLSWFMRGRVDLEYANYRYRVGAVHNTIGLAPNWYLGMFHVMEEHIVAIIREATPEPERQGQAIVAFLKMLSLDMQLAMEAYITAYVSERTSQLERLQRMQTTLVRSSQDLAATSEELSSSSEEMSAAVVNVKDDCREMYQHTEQIRQTAETGAQRMQQVADTIRQVAGQMDAMREKVALLADSSRQMEAIVKAVDHIAKQTNLLSLNAAIEAARAGQHGRGFAVVADEVRKLSDRTSASLREINKLIATSNDHVAAVQATTQEAGTASQAGMVEAGTAEREFSEIRRLVREGAERIQDITQAMVGLADMADHLRAGAEQNAAMAVTLSDVAGQE